MYMLVSVCIVYMRARANFHLWICSQFSIIYSHTIGAHVHACVRAHTHAVFMCCIISMCECVRTCSNDMIIAGIFWLVTWFTRHSIYSIGELGHHILECVRFASLLATRSRSRRANVIFCLSLPSSYHR